jgi:NADPH:quinone reductase-like Zn-dependent oxidoreductase
LIGGASGFGRTLAVQIAEAFGAEATAARSTRNLDMAPSIGIYHAIDDTREDVTRSGHWNDLDLCDPWIQSDF